jgi:hypothetical protein
MSCGSLLGLRFRKNTSWFLTPKWVQRRPGNDRGAEEDEKCSAARVLLFASAMTQCTRSSNTILSNANIVPHTLLTITGQKKNRVVPVHCVEIFTRSKTSRKIWKNAKCNKNTLSCLYLHWANTVQRYNKLCVRHVNKSRNDAESCLF